MGRRRAARRAGSLIDRSLVALADAPDSIADDRTKLEATIAELDRKIRAVGQQVLDEIIRPAAAKALNAPMIAQRDTAQLSVRSEGRATVSSPSTCRPPPYPPSAPKIARASSSPISGVAITPPATHA